MQQGFVLTRQSRDKQGHSQIVFWLHTAQGPCKLILDRQQPVFFLPQHEQEQACALLTSQFHFDVKALPLEDFQHQAISAFYFDSLQAYHRAQELLRSQFIIPLEGDIRLHDRYLMERFCNGGVEFIGTDIARQGYREIKQGQMKPGEYRPQLRLLSIDIECDMDGSLFSVGLHNDDIARVIMIGEPQDCEVETLWVKDEKALLGELVRQINLDDPDILIGWNVINFDIKLLYTHAQKYGINLNIGRDGSALYFRQSQQDSNQGFANIAGRLVVDGIDALKSATYQFDSFSLEFVAQAMLGEGKQVDNVHDRMAEIRHNFHHHKDKLAAYNLQDCVLVSRIFAHTKIIDYLILRQQITGLELDRSGGSVAAFTHLYLPKLHRAGYVAPNLPEDGGLASPGGYVMNSLPGLYEHVLVLDFKSLYPSIIRTFKIDPLGLIEGLKNPENAIDGFKGAKFSRDKHFLPDIITGLWQQRDEAKKAKDAARSQAIKILMNSFYGVLGSGGCRFYDTRLASSITMRGHQIMQQTAEWIEAQGHKVIYGDTDSTFVLLSDIHSDQQADDIGIALSKLINQKWQQKLDDEFGIQCYLELEYETHYQKFLMPTIRGAETGSKKRYAGLINKNGKEELVFKGLETVRTDWTELAKEFQTELYHRVFHDLDVADFIQDTIARTLSGRNDDKLVYSKRLRRKLSDYVKNVPPHVRAARIADDENKKRGRPLQYQHKGQIKYVITTAGPEPLEYQSLPLDYQHYIDKQIRPVAEAILPFIHMDFAALTDKQLPLF